MTVQLALGPSLLSGDKSSAVVVILGMLKYKTTYHALPCKEKFEFQVKAILNLFSSLHL